MKATTRFKLKPESATEANTFGNSRLMDGDRPGPVLDGAVIEAQFDMDDGRFLLLIGDDSPYEERLQVLLFGPALEQMDSLEIGAPYAAGVVDDVVPSKAELSFRFAERQFTVRARKNPRFVFPGSLPSGIRRSGAPWRKRYLEISNAH